MEEKLDWYVRSCNTSFKVADVLTNVSDCVLTATCPLRGGVSPAEGPTPPAPPPPPPQQQPQPDGYWNMHLEVLRSGSPATCLYLLLGFVEVPSVLVTRSAPHLTAWPLLPLLFSASNATSPSARSPPRRGRLRSLGQIDSEGNFMSSA